jgi:hypothetical protein
VECPHSAVADIADRRKRGAAMVLVGHWWVDKAPFI